MNRLQLRSLFQMVRADPDGVSDADLLARYRRDGDEAAFAALVNRYGRLVWAVCRHQTRSDADAEDAFQATFVVLARNAGAVRKTTALGAWLHGVAYKVCAKARRASQARLRREQAASRVEAATDVPDSAWDRALAAVHDELARLPETLRTPFVLCCLEGKGTTAAAEQLGWKLGTLSGRLTRAKNLLMARLEARGLTAGAVAAAALTGGAASAPAAVAEKVLALAGPGAIIPKSISILTQGVLDMGLHKAKLLAAGLILACGLGTTVGPSWVARAGGQDNPTKQAPAGKPGKPVATVEELLQVIQSGQDYSALTLFEAIGQQPRKETYTAATKKWEYDFVLVSEMGPQTFVKFLQEREDRGWEFNGQLTVTSEGKPSAVWMFRRPNATNPDILQRIDLMNYLKDHKRISESRMTPPPLALTPSQIRIKELEDELARLKGAANNKMPDLKQEKTFKSDQLPLGASEMADILRRLKREGYSGMEWSAKVQGSDLILYGDKKSLDWATGIISALMRK